MALGLQETCLTEAPQRPWYGEFPRRSGGYVPLTIRNVVGARRAFWKVGAVYLWHGVKVRVREVRGQRVYLSLVGPS